jgi:hypothetical protein
MLDLAWRGLANVHVGGALGVRGLDLGWISHWFSPRACPIARTGSLHTALTNRLLRACGFLMPSDLGAK